MEERDRKRVLGAQGIGQAHHLARQIAQGAPPRHTWVPAAGKQSSGESPHQLIQPIGVRGKPSGMVSGT